MWKQLITPLLFAVTIFALFSLVNAQVPGTSAPAASSSPSSDITELQKKAVAGDSSAAYTLGRVYETGKDVRQNLQLAVFWYRNAAEWGNAAAQSSLGVLYWLGEGVDKDKKEAVKWYHKAARQGDANAMFNLGVAHYNGEGANVDDIRALAWFLLASEAGSTAGQDAAKRSRTEHPRAVCDAYISIGEMYEKGADLPHDLKAAAEWYRRATREHVCDARLHLTSVLLNSGNYNEALELCKATAKEHHPAGAYCLGHLYQQGLGVSQDLTAAFHWFDQGAKGGNTAAMLALAQMYENGQATKVDRVEAIVLLIRASTYNREAAAEARKLRAVMSEQEWKKTQQRLRQINFDPQKIDIFLREDSSQVAH